jgi:predicted Rossmann-fold nucleotide-binding protein
MGTLEEFCEIVTWAQLGLHRKPCGLLNVAGFYDPLLALVGRMVADRFVREAHAGIVLAADTPADLLARMRAYTPVQAPKWIDRDRNLIEDTGRQPRCPYPTYSRGLSPSRHRTS